MQDKKSSGVTITRQQLVIVAFIIILLIVCGVIIGVNWSKWFGKTKIPEKSTNTSVSSSNNVNADIDPNAATWSDSSLKDKTGSSSASKGIKIPGYPSINLPADKTDVQVVLLNPEGNPCYFTFEIVLDDKSQTIYTSKQVPPGSAVKNIKLSKPLSKGTYNATIKITTNSLVDMSPMNGANVRTQLIVE